MVEEEATKAIREDTQTEEATKTTNSSEAAEAKGGDTTEATHQPLNVGNPRAQCLLKIMRIRKKQQTEKERHTSSHSHHITKQRK